MDIDSGALDRALCEELGIAGQEQWVVGSATDHVIFGDGITREIAERWAWENAHTCRVLGYTAHAAMLYPRLSTTGEGMRLLAEALAANYPEIEIHFALMLGWWRASVSIDDELTCERNDERLPMAFALAVAGALGLEVPE